MFEDQQEVLKSPSPETEIESMYQNAQAILDNLGSCSRPESRAQTGLSANRNIHTPGSRLAMLQLHKQSEQREQEPFCLEFKEKTTDGLLTNKHQLKTELKRKRNNAEEIIEVA